MQVRKFEARTMKEALQMVKTELGHEAIILSAREVTKGFGLVGESSVEITAAISQDTLKKKQFVESKIKAEEKQKLNVAPAKVQKQYMQKMISQYTAPAKSASTFSNTRYIDIDSDTHENSPASGVSASVAEQRIKDATQRAAQVFLTNEPRSVTRTTQVTAVAKSNQGESSEILTLKSEIASLKKIIDQFQNVPQAFTGQHPGADYGITYDLSFMFEKLTQIGISADIAGEMLVAAQDEMPAIKIKNKALVEAWVAKHILNSTLIADRKDNNKIHIFVGPPGAGKTSSLIKYASHLMINENKHVAVLTTDTFKVGSVDQLRIYTQILNIPFGVVRNQTDWVQAIEQLHLVDVVLVDMPGLTLKNIDEISALKKMFPQGYTAITTHLVLAATQKDSDMIEMARKYKVVNYNDLIVTKVDESTQHGTIYNLNKKTSTPIHSFGMGVQIPEDYELGTKERVLDLIFKITKLKKQESLNELK